MIKMLTHPREEVQRDTRPIASICALRCGWAEQHWEHRYGSRAPRLWWVLFGRRWVPLPLHCFLIAHRGGLVLFDTGIDPAVQFDRGYVRQAIGRVLLPRIFKFHLSEADRLDHVLAAHGVDAAEIRLAIISHLHFDHVGGIARIPQADLLVSEREWAILSKPHPERDWILREHIEIPSARWRPVSFQPADDPFLVGFNGAHDVAGDGSMVLLPTPGHTPGSMSLLVRQEGWNPILLVGDLTYETASLERGIVPGTGDRDTILASFAEVRALKERLPDLAIVPSHDFGAEEALSRATHRAPTQQGEMRP